MASVEIDFEKKPTNDSYSYNKTITMTTQLYKKKTNNNEEQTNVKIHYLGNGLPIVETLQDLIHELRAIFESDSTTINVDLISYLMKTYKSRPIDWKKYALFDRYRYTRNLVDTGNEKYNLMIVCWGEGHGSAIHNHANSHCFMKMLQGSLEEVRFAWPGKENSNELSELKEIKRTQLNINELCYINDSMGLHRIENASNVDTAISLHLYCPPYTKCLVFNQSTGQKNTVSATFHSVYGKRNREANQVCQPEDN